MFRIEEKDESTSQKDPGLLTLISHVTCSKASVTGVPGNVSNNGKENSMENGKKKKAFDEWANRKMLENKKKNYEKNIYEGKIKNQ